MAAPPGMNRDAVGQYAPTPSLPKNDKKAVRAVLPVISFATPRLVIKAIEDACNNVRLDPTVDVVTLAKVQLEAARISAIVHASNLDAKIDALHAKVMSVAKRLQAEHTYDSGKMLPIARPAQQMDAEVNDEPIVEDVTLGEDGVYHRSNGRYTHKPYTPAEIIADVEEVQDTVDTMKYDPLGGPSEMQVPEQRWLVDPETGLPVRRPPGRPRKTPKPIVTMPNIPNSAVFNEALEEFVNKAVDDISDDDNVDGAEVED